MVYRTDPLRIFEIFTIEVKLVTSRLMLHFCCCAVEVTKYQVDKVIFYHNI